MCFLFSVDLLLGEKVFGNKKIKKSFFFTCIPFLTCWKIFHSRDFLCLVELSFLDLDFLYIVAAIPHRRRIGGEGG